MNIQANAIVTERSWLACLVALVMLCAAPASEAQRQVGKTLFARGAATASLDGNVRLMGNGTPVFENDVLTTGSRSFAIVEFDDGTKMTLRPKSVFRVEEYEDEAAGQESLLLRMFRGGLRAVTGLVARRNPEAFKIQTSIATIGIRGTDFSARICDEDCVAEQQRLGADGAPVEPSPVVARVAFLRGNLSATNVDGATRAVRLGGSVYEKDTLSTDARGFAVIAFRDESRVTLQPNTEFQIERHEFVEAEPESGSSLMRLLRGGIRAVSGLIAKRRPSAYQVATPVATIGVRGTSFDLVCQGACAGDERASLEAERTTASLAGRALARLLDGIFPAAQAQAGLNGMFVVTRIGSLIAELLNGDVIDVPENSTAFFGGPTAPPRFDIPLPQNVVQNLGPEPEGVPVDPNTFQERGAAVEPGQLWATVNDEGHMTLTQDGITVELGRGEAAVAGETGADRVAGGAPAFIRQDPYNFSPDVDVQQGQLLQSAVPDPDSQSLECQM